MAPGLLAASPDLRSPSISKPWTVPACSTGPAERTVFGAANVAYCRSSDTTNKNTHTSVKLLRVPALKTSAPRDPFILFFLRIPENRDQYLDTRGCRFP